MCVLSLPGTPRTSAEAYDDSPKYKQIKRESPPIRSFDGGIGKGKPYDGVNTIQELGRSIHEIPRQDQPGGDSRKTPDMADRRVLEGPMSQVRHHGSVDWSRCVCSQVVKHTCIQSDLNVGTS